VRETPIPKPGGERETFVIEGLDAGSVYYIGLRAWDEAGNAGSLSNVVVASAGTVSSGAPAPRSGRK
jgi:hypothetical protein